MAGLHASKTPTNTKFARSFQPSQTNSNRKLNEHENMIDESGSSLKATIYSGGFR